MTMQDPFTHEYVGIEAPMRLKDAGFMTCVAFMEGEEGGSSWRYSNNNLVYTNSHKRWREMGWYKWVKSLYPRFDP